jgi:KamA family protein
LAGFQGSFLAMPANKVLCVQAGTQNGKSKDHCTGSGMNQISVVDASAGDGVIPNKVAGQFKVYTHRDIDSIPQLKMLPNSAIFEMRVVSSILPFRVNQYVIDNLIDWSKVPDDPLYQLTFPQKDMIPDELYTQMAQLFREGASREKIQTLAGSLRLKLNPQPNGQLEMNVPLNGDGNRLNGLQHKYRETVLFFPTQGQTCHSYCTFCFRWAQFVGDENLRMASTDTSELHAYLAGHPDVTDLLVTGGDPMVMKTRHLASLLMPLTENTYSHIRTIRLGTKALTFWPQRFVSDNDAPQLLDLLSQLVDAGKHVAIMAHFNHWREMDTPIARRAIELLRQTGVEIRSQGPVLAHINDSPDVWAKSWGMQVKAGIIPYYMFVERDTGARQYFEIPLARAWSIYREAVKQLSGLGRTARGPVMSASPGKVEVQGVTEIKGEKVFALRFLQSRNPDWAYRPFFAQYCEKATWLDQLKPAFGEKEFFFEREYNAMLQSRKAH